MTKDDADHSIGTPRIDRRTAGAAHGRPHSTRREVIAGLAATAVLGGCSSGEGGLLGYPGMLLDPPPPGNGQIAANYPDLIGRVEYRVVGPDDTLIELARHHGLGFTEIVAANPSIDPWMPPVGRRILLPKAHLLPAADHTGIVLNLADQRLYYFVPGGGKVITFPVGIGSAGWNTPLGHTKVTRKRANPIWYVPKSVRAQQPELPAVVPAGPDNPLGSHALYLGWPSYLIHGTNKPWGVGRRASHGCIRLYPEDIAKVYAITPLETPVLVVDQEAKLGWSGDELLLEVHPSQHQADELEANHWPTPAPVPGIEFALRNAAGEMNAERIDWDLVSRLIKERSGIPTPVLKPTPPA